MEAVGTFQVISYSGQALYAGFSWDKAAFDAHQQTGHAESATADGDDVLILFRIVAIQMDALGRQAGDSLCTVPHVVQVYFLDVVQHLVVRSK